MLKRGKVLIGMSGGIDSSVAAAILKKQGYECIGVYLNLWADPTQFSLEEQKKFPQNKCCSIESLIFARSICQKLDIPFYSINFEETFKEKVVDYFLEQHRTGETPNPCVRCNKSIKFGALFQKMEELGCDFLATGHYAKLVEKGGTIQIHRGKDKSKDQSYFLYNLDQEKLKKLIFPIGQYDKKKVRKLAKKFNLTELENKKESQGVCFYPEKEYFQFLKRQFKEGEDFSAGQIKNTQGETIGQHSGLPFYTIGQRKGIGIGGGPALYVNKVDKISNAVIVGSEDELFTKEIEIREANFLSGEAPPPDKFFNVKIRNHGRLAKAKIQKNGDKYLVTFKKPQRAVMAGQSLVLYQGKKLLGGGIMTWS